MTRGLWSFLGLHNDPCEVWVRSMAARTTGAHRSHVALQESPTDAQVWQCLQCCVQLLRRHRVSAVAACLRAQADGASESSAAATLTIVFGARITCEHWAVGTQEVRPYCLFAAALTTLNPPPPPPPPPHTHTHTHLCCFPSSKIATFYFGGSQNDF